MQYSSTIYKFKNIKNKSYDIIYIIKNYFIIIFLIFNFNNNKYNPNVTPIYFGCIYPKPNEFPPL